MPAQAPLDATQIRQLAALVAPEPVKHGRVTAALLVADPGDTIPHKDLNHVAKLRITVPTKWAPPMHDEDGYLSPISSPYDRDLIIPSDENAPAAGINLLDLISVPTEPIESPPSSPVTMKRRQTFSPAGKNALMIIGGDVQAFTTKLVIGASKIGATFYLDEVTAEDGEAFGRYQECDVHIDFAFTQAME